MEKRIKIDIHMNIMELLGLYPELAEVLTYQYGLHCVNCFIASFDTLADGAKIHGIEGEYFEKMITHLEKVVNREE